MSLCPVRHENPESLSFCKVCGLPLLEVGPEFSRLVGSKFNYHFLCAKNEANPTKPPERIASLRKEKIWKIMDAVLSIGWKTEAYRRKPVLMDTLNSEQKKAYNIITSLYEGQIQAHPADYKKFTALFEKSFKYYL